MVTLTTSWCGNDGSLFGAIDVTQDVTAQASRDAVALRDRVRVRSLAVGLVLRDEALRYSLATQIQAGICQDLALAKLKLSMLRTGAGTALRDAVSSIEHLVEQADRSLNAISLQISPPALHEFGLVPALQWLCEEIERDYGLSVRLSDDDAPPFAEERLRVILFRAVRELLVNVATHGVVQVASVRVFGTAETINVVVEDLGIGFGIEELQDRGLGLYAIQQQMQYLGGTIEVDSTMGVGTRVTLTVPIGAAV